VVSVVAKFTTPHHGNMQHEQELDVTHSTIRESHAPCAVVFGAKMTFSSPVSVHKTSGSEH
jgi:hypothetical protein